MSFWKPVYCLRWIKNCDSFHSITNVYLSKTADWLSKAHLILIFTREHFFQDYMTNPGNRAYTQLV